jgi:hypothetical protein
MLADNSIFVLQGLSSRSSSRARAERERMTADAEFLAEALRHDLIGPDDFMVAAARVR